jgi:hypothetical protein
MSTPSPQAVKRGLGLNVFLWLGVLMLVGAAIWCWSSIAATRGMTRTEAVVAGFSHEGVGLDRYASIYRFVTLDGKIVSVRGLLESTEPVDDPGDTVTIYYDPANGARSVIIDSFGERWFGVVILTLLGVVFAAIGVFVRVSDRRGGVRSVSSKLSMAARRAARDREVMRIGCALIAFGTLGAVAAALSFFHQIEITRNYGRASGTVVDSQERVSRTQSATHLHSAIVEFVAADGRQYTFAQGSSSSGGIWSDKVDVLYDPHNPQRAIVDAFWDRWIWASLFTLLGSILLAAGVFVCAVTWRGARTSKRTQSAKRRAQT